MLKNINPEQPPTISAVQEPAGDTDNTIEGAEVIQEGAGSRVADDAVSQSAAGLPPELLRVISLSESPVLLVDAHGFFTYANEAANIVLGYRPGQIEGVHFTEVCEHELSWLQTQFEHLVANAVWGGHIVLRTTVGEPISVAVNAASLPAPRESGPAFIAFIRPLAQTVTGGSLALESLPSALDAAGLRLLQLFMEGLEVADVAIILGVEESAVRRHINRVLSKLHAGSLTEACVFALKQHVIT